MSFYCTFLRVLFLLAAFMAALATGCATTTKTTATLETTMHAPDAVYRFQSNDLTARFQVEMTR